MANMPEVGRQAARILLDAVVALNRLIEQLAFREVSDRETVIADLREFLDV